MKVLHPELRKNVFTPYVYHIVSPKKRQRRTAAEIQRPFTCPMLFCQKAYGTETALKTHIKLKHKNTNQPSPVTNDWVNKKEVAQIEPQQQQPQQSQPPSTVEVACSPATLPIDSIVYKDFWAEELLPTEFNEEFLFELGSLTDHLSNPPTSPDSDSNTDTFEVFDEGLESF